MRRALGRWLGLSLSGLAGVGLVAAFAPLSQAWLAPFVLAIPFTLAARGSVRHAAAIGTWFGLGLFGVGVAWVHIAIETFGGPVWLAWLAVGGLALGLALFPALAFALAARLGGASAGLRVFGLLPGLWVLAEWLRGWVLSGFPWLQIGYSQTTTGWAGWVAPVGGVLAISLICAFYAGALAWAWLAGRPGVVLGLVAMWLAIGAVSPPGRPIGTRPDGTTLRVSLVQGDIAQARKWQPGQRQAIVTRYRDLSTAYWSRAELIVWPETAIPSVYRDGQAEPFRSLAEQARRTGTHLIAGTLRRDGRRIFNSMIDLGSGRHADKRHLVPFGEYVPAGRWLHPILEILGVPVSDVAAAKSAAPLAVAGTRAGMPICYEMAFAGEVAARARGAGVLINASDDAWFGRSIGLWQNLEIARMRALETGRPVIRATNTGLTAVIGADGRLRATLAPFAPGVLYATLSPRVGLTPYLRGGHRWPLIWAALWVIGAILLGRRRRWPSWHPAGAA